MVTLILPDEGDCGRGGRAALVLRLLLVAVIGSGCSVGLPAYSVSRKNVAVLRSIPTAIAVGHFAGTQTTVNCRGASLGPEGGGTFASYIQNALDDEIDVAYVEPTASTVELNGALTRIGVDCGVSSASWIIEMELTVASRPPFTVRTNRAFEGHWDARLVVEDARTAFVQAVHGFVKDVLSRPAFQAAAAASQATEAARRDRGLAFAEARALNTPAAYQEFLVRYPGGPDAIEARSLMKAARREERRARSLKLKTYQPGVTTEKQFLDEASWVELDETGLVRGVVRLETGSEGARRYVIGVADHRNADFVFVGGETAASVRKMVDWDTESGRSQRVKRRDAQKGVEDLSQLIREYKVQRYAFTDVRTIGVLDFSDGVLTRMTWFDQ